MEVFFVRHGQTDGNLARRHQHSETPLNALGKAQIAEVAQVIVGLAPTHIVTSTQLRAVESARVLAELTGIIPLTHSAFAELDRPNWLVGHRFLSLTTLRYVWAWFFDSEIEGGESYAAFRERIAVARMYLESFPKDARIVVVSHSVFTNLFLEHMCLREGKITFKRAVLSFMRIFTLRNGGLVHLRCEPREGVCGWVLLQR